MPASLVCVLDTCVVVTKVMKDKKYHLQLLLLPWFCKYQS